MMLFLDDAMKVIKRETDLSDDELEMLEIELEQKCWIGDSNDDIISLAMDVNPQEIASHIENDTLGEWCKTLQAEMIMKVRKNI